MANTAKDQTRELQRALYRAAKQSTTRRFHVLFDKVYRWDILQRAWQEVKELSRKRRAENGRKYRVRWEMRIGKQHVSDHRGQHG
jgi:hypothetical protein